MRTTLDIDEDVLVAAKELARRQRKTAGKLASELMREALQSRTKRASKAARSWHGFRPIPAGQSPVTNELVNEMRDELGI